ncbi:DNA polymerase III [Azospirillum picis]|uniref:DNA polymerase-3 subunit epsilon n=1 Tax=Azospirillum picis TaxID=488438 RepID=A0ABU0MJX4_9PROT|nr:DNA polymerase III [Azospirillum picis]MBP2299997.1 DNA polymerase-3 subunit epsilon [Azospirillum picis]MDQ0533765.1 DNA polymerase-3 subunit epsilon [Azospirillum picis]
MPNPDSRERVAIHCEATSYDPAVAQPLAVAAIRIRGNRILTGSALRLHPGSDCGLGEAGDLLRAFIGDRPLVGYFLDFSAAMAERLNGRPLANERVEVSALYYARKIRTASKQAVDLRLDSLIRDLDLPVRADDAFGTALAAAMAWLRLTQDGR